jgi:uncharacterized membrane protein YeaQ/YmgE (transglycosylase-associated protein family)
MIALPRIFASPLKGALGLVTGVAWFWVGVLVAFIGACIVIGVGHAVANYRNA